MRFAVPMSSGDRLHYPFKIRQVAEAMAGDLVPISTQDDHDRRFGRATISIISVNYNDPLPIIRNKELFWQIWQRPRPHAAHSATTAVESRALLLRYHDNVAPISGIISGGLEGAVSISANDRRTSARAK